MKDPVHLLDNQDPSRYTADRSYNVATSSPPGSNGHPTPAAEDAAAADSSSSMSPVKISTKYHVDFGDTIKLVGSHEALGAWDPTQALGMTWSEGDVWTALAQLPAGQHEFKVRGRRRSNTPSAVARGWNVNAGMSTAMQTRLL